MANSISLSAVYDDLDPFLYRPESPTYYTEMLSYRTLKMNALLAAAGGKMLVENATAEEQQAAAATYLVEFKAWLEETSASVSAWLLEEEDARALPVIAAAPLLPAIMAGAVVLYKGTLVKMAIDSVTTIIRTASQVQAERRSNQLVRIVDKALNDQSWWGGNRSSWLGVINSTLEQMSSYAGNAKDYLCGSTAEGYTLGISDMLYHLLTKWNYKEDGSGEIDHVDTMGILVDRIAKNPGLIRLLLQAVITSGGNIDMIDFEIMPTESSPG